MIGRSISITVFLISITAFDTDLVIKIYTSFYIVYTELLTETILHCSVSKILDSIIYIIVRYMQMLEYISMHTII